MHSRQKILYFAIRTANHKLTFPRVAIISTQQQTDRHTDRFILLIIRHHTHCIIIAGFLLHLDQNIKQILKSIDLRGTTLFVQVVAQIPCIGKVFMIILADVTCIIITAIRKLR